MTPEDDLLREALEKAIREVARRWIYLTAHNGSDHLLDGIAREAAQAALATRLSAAHQPAAPAWGDGMVRLARAAGAYRDAHEAGDARTARLVLGGIALTLTDEDLALPPPAPGLDPEQRAEPMKMLVDDDWLRRKVESTPDGFDVEAGQPAEYPAWRPAYDNLREHQRQLDRDGVEVGVSREALDQVLNALSDLPDRTKGKADSPAPSRPTRLSEEDAAWIADVLYQHTYGIPLASDPDSLSDEYLSRARTIIAMAPPADAGLGKSALRCEDCSRENPVWFAPNPVWNAAIGGPDAKGDPGGILCPVCFIRRAEAKGIVPTAWELRPESQSAQTRPCTCHPDDNPPVPCPRKYALSECRAASQSAEVERVGWRPIESAPKKGSFLAAIHHGDRAGYLVVEAKRIGPGVHGTSEGSAVGWRPGHPHPAYWMPKPVFTPPAPETEGG